MTEKVTLSVKGGELSSIDKSYRVLGITEYPGIGRVMTRASGAFATFRYNVSRIIGEKPDGEDTTYELESLPASTQEEIFRNSSCKGM